MAGAQVIDAKAKFIFGTEPSKHPKALPFDMADVEFSHHGMIAHSRRW